MMLFPLLIARNSIIFWLTIGLVPIEVIFDAIENEIGRQS